VRHLEPNPKGEFTGRAPAGSTGSMAGIGQGLGIFLHAALPPLSIFRRRPKKAIGTTRLRTHFGNPAERLRESVTHGAQDQHDDEDADQDGEKARGQRQIVDLTHCVGRSGSLVLVFDGDGDRAYRSVSE
jgi:hypothetical protein